MNWLREQYVKHPDVTALHADGETLNYRRLYERAAGIALRLEQKHGLRPGDRVATLLGNTLSHAVLLHALMLLRVTLVPLNPRLRDEETRKQAAHAGVKLLIEEDRNREAENTAAVAGDRFPETEDRFPETEDRFPETEDRFSESEDRFSESEDRFSESEDRFSESEDRFSESEEDDLLSIIFTSGTSRRPKAVPHSYRNHETGALASAANLGVRANDNWLCPLPLHHIGGLAILVRSVIYGTAVTLLDGFEERLAARTIREQDISIVSFVPTMLHRLLLIDQDFTASSLPSLRVILLGGGPAGDELRKEIRRRDLPVLGTYGLTETCSQVTTMCPGKQEVLSAGKPLGDAEIVIRDSEGKSCPTGESGEIHIRCSTMTTGYLGDEELNDRSFTRGWFRSGDNGFLDDLGNLHVLSRREDLIVSGGENILASEVEDRIQAHADVREAAVVGIEDEEWGQVVSAVIVPENVMEETEGLQREIEKLCRMTLAGYKIPRRWLFLRELPRTSSGKIRREHLRRLFGG